MLFVSTVATELSTINTARRTNMILFEFIKSCVLLYGRASPRAKFYFSTTLLPSLLSTLMSFERSKTAFS